MYLKKLLIDADKTKEKKRKQKRERIMSLISVHNVRMFG